MWDPSLQQAKGLFPEQRTPPDLGNHDLGRDRRARRDETPRKKRKKKTPILPPARPSTQEIRATGAFQSQPNRRRSPPRQPRGPSVMMQPQYRGYAQQHVPPRAGGQHVPQRRGGIGTSIDDFGFVPSLCQTTTPDPWLWRRLRFLSPPARSLALQALAGGASRRLSASSSGGAAVSCFQVLSLSLPLAPPQGGRDRNCRTRNRPPPAARRQPSESTHRTSAHPVPPFRASPKRASDVLLPSQVP